jgi:hypothetical protein
MIIALAILSVLMTACGAVALVNGWDVVLTERGWSQVIAGATGLSAGVVLIGLTCVVAELKRLRREITAVMDTPDDDLSLAPANPALTGGAAGAGASVMAAGSVPQNSAPAGSAAPQALSGNAAPPAAASVPDADQAPSPETRPADSYEEAAQSLGAAARADQVQPDEDSDSLAPDPAMPVLQATPYETAFAQAAEEPDTAQPFLPAEPPAPPPASSEIIGSYASAGITYYLYADNAIEAEMEQGRFRFENMDELRRFLETGDGGLLLADTGERSPLPG